MIHDACCAFCRSSTGVCLTRLRCDHHVEALRLQAAEDNYRTPHRDPTATTAINRVMRERKNR